MLGTAGWQKKTTDRLFGAFVISSLVSAFLLSACVCAEVQPYNGRCPSGKYRSPTAEQGVKEPGP
jgi:hypothetical protein